MEAVATPCSRKLAPKSKKNYKFAISEPTRHRKQEVGYRLSDLGAYLILFDFRSENYRSYKLLEYYNLVW